MEKYDYREALRNDIKEFLEWESQYGELGPYDTESDMYDNLYERMMDCDSVTGNETCYTDSEWDAEEYLCHNMDLLAEAFETFGYNTGDISRGAKWCDVIIRCYLLGEVLNEVLDDGWYEQYVHDEAYEDDDEEQELDEFDFYIGDIGELLN